MSAQRRPSRAAMAPHALNSSVFEPPSRKEQRHAADQTVPSFSTFRAQAAPTAASSSVRRKPVQSPPSNQQPRFPSISATAGAHPPYQQDGDSARLSTTSSAAVVVRDLDQYPHGQSPLITEATNSFASLDAQAAQISSSRDPRNASVEPSFRQNHEHLASTSAVANGLTRPAPTQSQLQSAIAASHKRASSTMFLNQSAKPSKLNLQPEPRKPSGQSDESNDSTSTSKPRSPGAKLTSFFGWKSASPGPPSSSTSISDKGSSPGPSPRSPKSSPFTTPPSRVIPTAIDVPKANASLNMLSSQILSGKFDEMEEELKDISSELASSIRREMDLEDLVERLQSEATNPPGPNRRTSDYFSDAGTNSARLPPSESDAKDLELEKMQRKTEQEKAQLRVDLTQRVQEERSRRIALETHVLELEERVQKVGSLFTSMTHRANTFAG